VGALLIFGAAVIMMTVGVIGLARTRGGWAWIISLAMLVGGMWGVGLAIYVAFAG
jgi:hypothetical protein